MRKRLAVGAIGILGILSVIDCGPLKGPTRWILAQKTDFGYNRPVQVFLFDEDSIPYCYDWNADNTVTCEFSIDWIEGTFDWETLIPPEALQICEFGLMNIRGSHDEVIACANALMQINHELKRKEREIG